MKTTTILIFGAIAVVLLYLFSKSKAVTTSQTLAAQQLALNNQYSNTTAGQVSGIMASVGNFFNSGALQSLSDAFLNTGDSNQPGLVSTSGVSSTKVSGLNTPGLNDVAAATKSSSSSIYLTSLGSDTSSEDIYG